MDPVATPLPSGSTADAPKKAKRRSPHRPAPGRPPRHGAALLARLLKPIRLDRLDGRSHVGVMLRKQRDELLDHLGGEPSATELLLVEEIAKAAIITQAVGLWLLEQQSLGMKRAQAERTVADVFQEQHRAKQRSSGSDEGE